MARKKPDKTKAKLDCFLPRTRCTREELDEVQRRAAAVNLTASAYLRRMALSGRIMVKQAKADFETVNQLRRIGVNLNQMSRAIHAASGIIPPSLAETMATVETVMFRLMDE